ncbi:hypothetical protein FGG79_03600 [Bacillus sp. BHET2]|nr:hypothetical protein FGG79_03600 [Bacillus sp. BHET2]
MTVRIWYLVMPLTSKMIAIINETEPKMASRLYPLWSFMGKDMKVVRASIISLSGNGKYKDIQIQKITAEHMSETLFLITLLHLHLSHYIRFTGLF